MDRKELDVERILRILPHRSPFLLLDRVVDLQPRTSARGLKCVTYAEPVFRGAPPSHAIFPGVLILEAMSQLLAVLAYASEPFDPQQKTLHLVGLDGVKLRRPIVPGDRVVLDVAITQRRSNIWKAHATASVDTQLCVQADLLASLSDRSELPQP